MDAGVDSPKFWDERYDTGGDGWELGIPAPPLARLLGAAPPSFAPLADGATEGKPARGKVAVPGCGRGHDVGLFARLGYDAVGFDFSPRAVDEAIRRGHRVLQRDVFALADEFAEAFDAVWEYTCFCAIDPSRRAEYVDVMAGILKPGGQLIALFYPLKEGSSGPPFPVDRDEIGRLLRARFEVESSEVPADSVEARRGLELLVRARRRR